MGFGCRVQGFELGGTELGLSEKESLLWGFSLEASSTIAAVARALAPPILLQGLCRYGPHRRPSP